MSLRQLHLLVVNAITFIRVPFILTFLVLALVHGWGVQCVHVRHVGELPSDWWAIIALVCLTLSALTDLFDGALARKWKVVTKFGAMCDPLIRSFISSCFPRFCGFCRLGSLRNVGTRFSWWCLRFFIFCATSG